MNSDGAAPVPPSLAVHHDEIRRDAGFKHGFHDGQKFMRVADAQLEPDRLSA